jgi:hypothetical protein
VRIRYNVNVKLEINSSPYVQYQVELLYTGRFESILGFEKGVQKILILVSLGDFLCGDLRNG